VYEFWRRLKIQLSPSVASKASKTKAIMAVHRFIIEIS
jgi:hypothetical protein